MLKMTAMNIGPDSQTGGWNFLTPEPWRFCRPEFFLV